MNTAGWVVTVRALTTATKWAFWPRRRPRRSHSRTTMLTSAEFVARLDATLARARRHDTTTALLIVGVGAADRSRCTAPFPWRHNRGSSVLLLAERLRTVTRLEDSIGRLASGELAVLLNDVDDERSPARVAQRLLEAACPRSGTCCRVHIGITTTPMGAAAANQLLHQARTALVTAQTTTTNDYAIFDDDMHGRVRATLELERELPAAIDQRQFVVHYQPEIDLVTGAVIGVEALLRWQHPTRGLISPDEFIPLAEDGGHIQALGGWVLQEACETLRRLQQDLPELAPLRLSINVSPRQLTHAFVADLERICQDTATDARQLILEITESTFIDNPAIAADILTDIHRLGAQLAIDDFGTGYSALSYLHTLPVGVIKLDRFFIRHLNEPAGHAIVNAVLRLAETLGLTVTAEGVETHQQQHDLRRLGCSRAQGFLFARPIPEQDLRALLQAHIHSHRLAPHTAARSASTV